MRRAFQIARRLPSPILNSPQPYAADSIPVDVDRRLESRAAAEALEQFAQGSAIFKQLSDSNRLTPEYRDAQARSLDSQASVLRDQDHPDAESVFRQVLSIRRQLAADYYAVPHFRQGLAISLNNLAILLKKKDELSEAEMYYNQSLDIHRQLANDFPEVSDHQNNVAGAMVNVARLSLDRKDFEAARRLYEDALPFHRAAMKANDRHPLYRNFLRLNRWKLSETYLGLKDHAAAAATAQEFFDIAFEPGRDSYTAATLLAACVRLALQDERLTEMKRTELATAYGDRAMAAIDRAIEEEAKELTQMAKDPSLDALRSRKDFQKRLADWEARKKP
jgi:tetratricopeptide (TPR) repeat protein